MKTFDLDGMIVEDAENVAYLPTPAEIAAATASLRETWSDAEHRSRASGFHGRDDLDKHEAYELLQRSRKWRPRVVRHPMRAA